MKQKVNFKKSSCQTKNIKAKKFGICDDDDSSVKTPARISFNENEDEWLATVENETDESINFTAIDNCIEIYRVNGEIENRCKINY